MSRRSFFRIIAVAIGIKVQPPLSLSDVKLAIKTVTLASAGTGTILAGDIITFAGDSQTYVVTSGVINATWLGQKQV